MTGWLPYALALVWLAAGGYCENVSYRLPLEVIPESYELSIVPHVDNESYDGLVTINVTAKKSSPEITLHAATWRPGLIIKRVEVSNMEVINTTDDYTDLFSILLAEALTIGARYTITVAFEGRILEFGYSMGFFFSRYFTSDGETRWLMATQAQPTYARYIFPCFDEPALKATFDIKIAPPSGLHALSNMPVESISDPDPTIGNRLWFKFQRTPPMSTYLVAFVVSDYCYVYDGGIQRIYGNCDEIEKARYPLSISQNILDMMINLTGHPYQLPKVDQVAVPNFGGAMENWGLVIYSNNYLLLPGEFFQQYSATIIAHELSHQWLGNQVSPKWWSYTWLNEAFASFYEFFIADKINPDWMLMEELVTDVQYWIIFMDSFEDRSEPLTRENVENTDEIRSTFDMITYQKGGCIIKQAYNFLTEPTFHKGLNIYLTRKAYDVAEPDDLFSAWQEAVDEDRTLPVDIKVKAVMDTWTRQAGFPLVTVTRNYAAGTATFTQRHFMAYDTPDVTRKWYIPISYTTGSEKDFGTLTAKLWLTPNQTLTLYGLAADDWFLINMQWTYYYRVNYDAVNWNRLLAAAESGDLPDLTVLQIEDDIWELSRTGDLPPGVNNPGISSRLSPSIASQVMYRRELPLDRSAGLASACGGAGPRACHQALRHISQNTQKVADRLGGPKQVHQLLQRMAPHLRIENQFHELKEAATAVEKLWPGSLSPEEQQQLLQQAEEAVRRNAANGFPETGWKVY